MKVDVDVEVPVDVDVDVEVLAKVDVDEEVLVEASVDVVLVEANVDVVPVDVVPVDVDVGEAVVPVKVDGYMLLVMRVGPADVCGVVMAVSTAITVGLMVTVEGRHGPPDKRPNI